MDRTGMAFPALGIARLRVSGKWRGPLRLVHADRPRRGVARLALQFPGSMGSGQLPVRGKLTHALLPPRPAGEIPAQAEGPGKRDQRGNDRKAPSPERDPVGILEVIDRGTLLPRVTCVWHR